MFNTWFANIQLSHCLVKLQDLPCWDSANCMEDTLDKGLVSAYLVVVVQMELGNQYIECKGI